MNKPHFFSSTSGIQYTKYGCRRKSDSRLVHRNFCETSRKPKPIRKRCNIQECSQPTWVTFQCRWNSTENTCTCVLRLQTVALSDDSQVCFMSPLWAEVIWNTYSSSTPLRACFAHRWVVDEWSPCSKTCGKLGYQTRMVQCMQALNNGTNRPVHSKHCADNRPDTRRTCNYTTCPAQWRTGAWSQVWDFTKIALQK